jgi:hypothetical protein
VVADHRPTAVYDLSHSLKLPYYLCSVIYLRRCVHGVMTLHFDTVMPADFSISFAQLWLYSTTSLLAVVLVVVFERHC